MFIENPLKPNRTVAFYARVSTQEEQQLKALPKQIEECRSCIKSNKWILVDEYIDEGKSGTKIKGRNEYQRLLEDLYADKFDIIVSKDQDRLQHQHGSYHGPGRCRRYRGAGGERRPGRYARLCGKR